MSFLSQKMANNFPRHSTVRSDASSNGQKIFSVFGDLFESKYVDILKVAESFKLNQVDLGIHKIYTVNLQEEDFFVESEENEAIYTFPTVKATIDGIEKELVRITGSENFLFGLPDTLRKRQEIPYTSGSDLIYTRNANGAITINTDEFSFYERLFVRVYNSTVYKKPNRDIPENQRPYGGFSFILIKGKDVFYNDIEEYIYMRRDGEFFTEKVFRKIDSVDIDGFDGSVEIRVSEACAESKSITDYIKTNKFNYTADKRKNGFSEVSLFNKTINFSNGSENVYFINLFSRFISDDSTVRESLGNQIDETLMVRTLLSRVVLWDKGKSDFLKPVDYFISEINSRLYILNEDGKIHIGNLTLNPFLHTEESRSEEFTVKSIVFPQRPSYGSDVRIRCELRRQAGPIKFWQIKIVSPSGVVYFVKYEFNNVTKTKNISLLPPSQHTGSYKNRPLVSIERVESNIPKYSWADFVFKFTSDEIGQWDVFTTIYFNNGTELTHKTSFSSDYWVAEKIVETGIDTSTNSLKGFFLSKENLLGVKTSSKIMFFEEEFHTYLADIINNRILTRSFFKELEVKYD